MNLRNNRLSITLVFYAVLTVLFLGWWLLPAPTLIINANLLTMDPQHGASDEQFDAVLINKGVISAIGQSEPFLLAKSGRTRVVDLQGKTLMPGFVDAHSHFPASHIAQLGIDLSSPPLGNIATIEQLQSALRQANKQLSKNKTWLVGFNYDNAWLEPNRHPNRKELDDAVADRAVILFNRSGHLAVVNTAGLLELAKANPSVLQGGSGQAHNGLLRESEVPDKLALLKRQTSPLRLFSMLRTAKDDYLAQGVTTAQNGHSSTALSWALAVGQTFNLIPQRIVVWPTHTSAIANNNFQLPKLPPESPTFKVGAIKIIVDGSPQGLTAWLTQPYANDNTNRGIALYSQQALSELVTQYHKRGYQLALHGNGDAAIDAILNALEFALQTDASNKTTKPQRHLLVHAQIMRKDQIEKAAALSLSPSFFNAHTFYWGDWHIKNLGEKRAANISPMHWAAEAGLRFSLHTDAPVTPMEPFHLMWQALNRRSSSGASLGQHQQISAEQALKALTIDAAWQNHLEDTRGSISVGKFADLIVLSTNPLHTDDVRNVQVQQTWIAGKRVYQR